MMNCLSPSHLHPFRILTRSQQRVSWVRPVFAWSIFQLWAHRKLEQVFTLAMCPDTLDNTITRTKVKNDQGPYTWTKWHKAGKGPRQVARLWFYTDHITGTPPPWITDTSQTYIMACESQYNFNGLLNQRVNWFQHVSFRGISPDSWQEHKIEWTVLTSVHSLIRIEMWQKTVSLIIYVAEKVKRVIPRVRKKCCIDY